MKDQTPQTQFPSHADVQVIELAPHYPAFVIDNAHAKATIALHGAHIIDYQPHGQDPIIFTSKDAAFTAGKAIRGGIPICWPWFNAHPTDASLPSHGYARSSFWTLDTITTRSIDTDIKTETSAATILTFSLPPQGNSQLSAQLEISIGKTLSLSLTTKNHGDTATTYSEALHTYFSVSDSREAELKGLDQLEYIDTVGEETTRTQSGVLTFPDEVDRIYSHHTSATLRDLINERETIISKTGSQTTITWNPGYAKGQAMADLNNEQIFQFICVETANARTQSITLAAGDEHTMTCTIGATATSK